ncbi:MAG: complex I NDUFA9 subunit family protein [Nitrospirota bacterium]
MLLITGATGFVGRNLVRELQTQNQAMRLLVRDPANVKLPATHAIEIIPGNILNTASLDRALNGVDRVVHLVGIIQEASGATFRSIHVEGTRNLLDAAKKAGVSHFFFMSALGTRPSASSRYHKTKWEAEELVRESGIPFTILRPSIIYGPGDGFTTRLLEVMRISPVLQVIGSGKTKVQPVFINDVITCISKTLTGDSFFNEVYEIGGPEQLTYEEVTRSLADIIGLQKPVLHMPFFFLKPMVKILEVLFPNPPLTSDQIIMLQENNICSMQDIEEVFGVEPVRFAEGIRTFLKPDA